VVVDGDTLTKISRQYYGTSARWDEIFQANRDTLANESSLTIGATLRIP
jgi:nucleoid-associated protein YgaU